MSEETSESVETQAPGIESQAPVGTVETEATEAMKKAQELIDRPLGGITPGGLDVIRGENQKKYPSRPGIIAEEKLAPQLASSPDRMMDEGGFDDRILSNLTGPAVAWISIAEIIPDHSGGRFWRRLTKSWKYNVRSEGGWTTKNILKAIGSLGGTPPRPDVARKPNVFSRNLPGFSRDWKDRARQEGKELPEE